MDPKLAVESDDKGVFRFDHLPAAIVDLVTYGSGLAPAVVPGIETNPRDAFTDLGTVILRQGMELVGRVVNDQGDPVPNTSVWLLDPGQSISRQGADRSSKKTPACRSGENGMFRLEDLAPATAIRLGLDAEGFRPAIADLTQVDPRKVVKFVLDRGSLLRGRVLNPDGNSVGGARVTISPGDTEAGVLGDSRAMQEERSVMTDDQGVFEVDELPGGFYRLEAYRDGFLSSAVRRVDLVPGDPLDGVELRLRDGATVEGWVLTESGEPVEGALVMFDRPAARTGADGAFLIEGVEPGQKTVEVRHPDFVWHEENRKIRPGENVIELRLHAGAGVSGHTLRSSGEPLAGVSVRLTRETRPTREYGARSDRDGGFRIDSVQPGTYQVQAMRDDLVQVAANQEIEVGVDGVDDVLIGLRSGAAIHGVIKGLNLDELARVHVMARNPESGSRRGRVDHSGAYRIERASPGVWWVRAVLPGGSRETEERVVVSDDASDVVQDLDLTSGDTLRGVVLVDGEPSASVQVSLHGLDRSVSRQAQTDLEGRFVLENLLDGRYRITASVPRASLVDNRMIELLGDREITIRIDSASVDGVVTSQATGEPLEDAVVTLGQLEGANGAEVSRVTLATDDRGGFHIARLSAGHYRLSVGVDGYVPQASDLEVVGGDSLDLDLALQPAAGLRLRVRESSGQSPSWASVRLSDPESGRRMNEIRALEGDRLVIPTVPPGVWDVLLAAPGGAPARLRVTIPGEPSDVVLPPAGRLRLKAPALDSLKREATIQVLDQARHPISALDGDTGAFRVSWPWRRNGIVIDAIPAGQWIVRAVGTDGATWVAEVSTSGSGESLVVLR